MRENVFHAYANENFERALSSRSPFVEYYHSSLYPSFIRIVREIKEEGSEKRRYSKMEIINLPEIINLRNIDIFDTRIFSRIHLKGSLIEFISPIKFRGLRGIFNSRVF